MNKTSIPPKKIKNRMYENQNDRLDSPVVLQIKIVWKRSPRPIASGWDSRVKIIDEIKISG